MRQRNRATRTTATIASMAMLVAGLIALTPQAAQAAPQVYETNVDDAFVVPANTNFVTITLHGAAGGAGGQTGGSGGRGAVQKIQASVTPGQVLDINVGAHGNNGALDATTGGGGGGAFAPGAGGGGGDGFAISPDIYGAGGGGGGAATSVYLDGGLLAVAAGGGGGGGTNSNTTPGGNGGNADANGQNGSDAANATGGEHGDAPTPDGGYGEDATPTNLIAGGGAGGGGGGWAGGSGGAFTASQPDINNGSSGAGGGGGDSWFDSAKANLVSLTATESGSGHVTIQYSEVFPTTLTFTNTPIEIVNREMHGYTLNVAAAGGQAAQPTGTVELSAESQLDGTIIPLGTKNVDASGNVKIFSDKLKAGDYILTGVYTPDAASQFDSLPSQATQPITVAKGDTQTIVSGPDNPVSFGDDAEFGVSVVPVDPAQGTPSGKVQFSTGSGNIGAPVTLDGDGKAVFTTDKLPVGVVDVTATYAGDKEFNGSFNDIAFQVVVNPGDVTVTLTEEHNPTISGENAYFNVQVTPTSAKNAKPAAGTLVELYDNGVLLDTKPINAKGYVQFVTKFLATNDNDHHHMSAVFNPGGASDPNFAESTSNFLDAVVNYGDVKVDVSSDANPQRVGKDVTFTVKVSGLKPTSYEYDPTGDIQLYVNGTAFNGPIAIDGSGVATITTSDLPVGTAEVYALYKGDDHYKTASSNILSQIIEKQLVDVTLTSNGSPKQYGEDVTLTATVTGESLLPKGTVTFYDNGVEYKTVAVDNNGEATVTSSKFAKGLHVFSAKYEADDESESGVSNNLEVLINKNYMRVEIVTNKIPAYNGEPILIHSKVSHIGSSLGKINGTVVYYANSKKIGSSPVSGPTWGSHVFKNLKSGPYRIVAKFVPASGSVLEKATSDTLIQRTSKAKANAKIGLYTHRTSDSTADLLVNVVKKSGGKASGWVRIYVNGDHVKSVKLSNGKATYELTGLPDEMVVVTAAYVGKGKTKPVSRDNSLQRF